MSFPRRTQARPGHGALTAGLLLFGVVLAVIVTGGLVTRAAMPDASGTNRALVVLVVMTTMTVAVRPWFGSWSDLGVNGPRDWARPALLVLPLLLALSPLMFGIRHVGPSTWALLVVGYVLTGFNEELLWRGIAQRLLDAIEEHAARTGLKTLRLDTNRTLKEAHALYVRNGYREIPRYNDNPYADHWFEKRGLKAVR